MSDQLDNPIWHALSTMQRIFAEGGNLARKFPAEITSLAGLREPSAEAFAELASMVSADETPILFWKTPGVVAPSWLVLETFSLLQMVHLNWPTPRPAIESEELGEADVPQMMSLAARTKPGPFGPRTYELGNFIGVRRNGLLLAMAGERLRLPGYAEVSAVCTHPEHTGNGYAGALIAKLVRRIQDRGEVSFLHVRDQNWRAIELYKRLGFEERVRLRLTVLLRT